MEYVLSMIVALGLSIAASVAAQQPPPGPVSAARIAELESRIAQVTQQINQLRANRLPDERWGVPQPPSLTVQAPASSLQRTFTVASVEAGCPQGAVCLVVRCDAPSGR